MLLIPSGSENAKFVVMPSTVRDESVSPSANKSAKTNSVVPSVSSTKSTPNPSSSVSTFPDAVNTKSSVTLFRLSVAIGGKSLSLIVVVTLLVAVNAEPTAFDRLI